MTWWRAVAVAVLLVVLLASAAWVMRARRGAARPMVSVLASAAVPGDARNARDVRIRVQVLNTTRTRGLARRATRLLRDQGYDVVEMGTTSPTIDTTLVLDRSHHPEWSAAVSRVLRPSRALSRPDSSRYLDVTVLLGSTWRPPAKPLDP
ncbi:MAG: LytR C-terminal domain-containing protein [Gemmatimonadaceae bacterium]